MELVGQNHQDQLDFVCGGIVIISKLGYRIPIVEMNEVHPIPGMGILTIFNDTRDPHQETSMTADSLTLTKYSRDYMPVR